MSYDSLKRGAFTSAYRLWEGVDNLGKGSLGAKTDAWIEFRSMIEMNPFKAAPVKPTVPLETFSKMDIRVGTIELVKDIPSSDKLVELVVDFGDRKRSVLVGMKKERENPKEIEGRQALFVVNLEPKKMMGRVSEGMLLDIGYEDGIRPVLAVPEEPVPAGARAG